MSRTDIPANLSFIAALSERVYYSGEEEGGEGRGAGPSSGRGLRRVAGPVSAPAGQGVRAPPPRSPDSRKRVRFADALGLGPGGRRRFRPGEMPRVAPTACHAQLQQDALRHFGPCPPAASSLQEARAALEPARDPAFAARLQTQRVCLERAEAGALGVSGCARVLDLAYEKRVSVRWSADGWRSQREVPAAYVGPAPPPPPRGDRFAFRLPAPPPGGALLFALRYRVADREYWDNNGGRDYALAGPDAPGGAHAEPQGWIHFV
ncbi:LOW QUALITY PROTEIN: protein phosphatase 1 regulatory subunit 3E [Ornithorhynchus anatinus]|uniref:LOW QUALITY PROTEIN: protein phosphatase 1 regulatory subunit 3E n=1 Tax=Ornithorhynchus anatinus TaxID=9258 RepID=UPI0010A87E74|nr:LOW QUALITY PROTEIN: protein phosphatase 1 regulatory subunit 3E [Ornithorhynchus anatinus]